MGIYKISGVYTKEKNEFPNSVVEAPTAIPAFIGITEKASDGNNNLYGKPLKISSMTEYVDYFGGPPVPKFMLSVITKTQDHNKLCIYDETKKIGLEAIPVSKLHTLYYHMVMFFANGGGTCYVISMGNYENTLAEVYAEHKEAVFANLVKEQDITMLVVPEAVNADNCMDIYKDLLGMCDDKKYFVILDIPLKKAGEDIDKPIDAFRDAIGNRNLSFAAAYYPWLETSVLSDKDITGEIFTWDYDPVKLDLKPFFDGNSAVLDFVKEIFGKIKKGTKEIEPESSVNPEKKKEIPFTKDELFQMKNDLHNALLQNWPEYRLLVKKVKDYLNLLPPSATMAGIYNMVDNTRGVWKTPANVSVNYVNKPSILIDNEVQEELNMPMNGKSINAIRSFTGEGIKVWGARTLDGNSLDWRYINVRRTVNFIETSVKNAARAYVFEPNDAGTWINMRCMMENFLCGIWKRGALAGATPEDAYSVHVGLGDTMTADDILDGILRITLLVALSHPAEFIEITFQQQMQKS